MNLITADFNWISIAGIIIAAIIGMIKSSSRKPVYPSQTSFPDSASRQEEWEEEYFQERTETPPASEASPEAADNSHQACPEKESPVYAAPEEETEERPQFDIRQAVISSEILKRPEY